MTVEEIVQYYSDLLIIQYNDKPKAKATIETLVNSLIADNVMIDVKNAFDIDTAVGVQLDVLGKYIGMDRSYKGTLFDELYFGFTDYFGYEPPLVTGFSDYADFSTKDGKFLGYEDVLSQNNLLEDEDYRLLLKLKIAQNNIDHSVASIDTALQEIFGASVYMVDDYNMTMIYFVPEETTALILAAIDKDVLLRPMGVGLKMLPNLTYFGMADYEFTYPDDIEGFSSYDDFLTKDGAFLGYDDTVI